MTARDTPRSRNNRLMKDPNAQVESARSAVEAAEAAVTAARGAEFWAMRAQLGIEPGDVLTAADGSRALVNSVVRNGLGLRLLGCRLEPDGTERDFRWLPLWEDVWLDAAISRPPANARAITPTTDPQEDTP